MIYLAKERDLNQQKVGPTDTSHCFILLNGYLIVALYIHTYAWETNYVYTLYKPRNL